MDMASAPASPRPDVSVVVVTARDAARLARCLASIVQAEPELQLEIVVVLNAAEPGMEEAALAAGPAIRVVRSDVPLGFAGGVQLGAASSRGVFLHLLHDDTVMETGAVSALVRALEAEPRAGAAGSLLLDVDDGATQGAGWVLWRDGRTEPGPVGGGAVDYCSSASLMVRADAWQAVDGVDEELHPAQFVDVDLAMRLRASGRVVIAAPASVVRHARGGSTNGAVRRVAWTRNNARFLQTWDEDLRWQQPWAEDPGAHARAAEATRRRADAVRALPLVPPPARPSVPLPREERERAALRRDLAFKDACARELGLADEEAQRLRGEVATLRTALAGMTAARDAERAARLELEAHEQATGARLSEQEERIEAQEARLAYLAQRESVLEATLAGRWWRARERLRAVARLVTSSGR